VLETSLPAGHADFVCSSAFLEHVPQLDAVVAELARITRPGGIHVHNLDYNDHGIYDGTAKSPISFLCEAETSSFVRTCNRIRPSQLLAAFRRQGFELLEEHDYESYEPTPAELRDLLPAFRELTRHDLTTTRAWYALRKQ
jgi:SAM-dependent methyltransferase